MAYDYSKEEECSYCARYGFTSKITSGLKINKFCVGHWDHYIKTGQLGYSNQQEKNEIN